MEDMFEKTMALLKNKIERRVSVKKKEQDEEASRRPSVYTAVETALQEESLFQSNQRDDPCLKQAPPSAPELSSINSIIDEHRRKRVSTTLDFKGSITELKKSICAIESETAALCDKAVATRKTLQVTLASQRDKLEEMKEMQEAQDVLLHVIDRQSEALINVSDDVTVTDGDFQPLHNKKQLEDRAGVICEITEKISLILQANRELYEYGQSLQLELKQAELARSEVVQENFSLSRELENLKQEVCNLNVETEYLGTVNGQLQDRTNVLEAIAETRARHLDSAEKNLKQAQMQLLDSLEREFHLKLMLPVKPCASLADRYLNLPAPKRMSEGELNAATAEILEFDPNAKEALKENIISRMLKQERKMRSDLDHDVFEFELKQQLAALGLGLAKVPKQ